MEGVRSLLAGYVDELTAQVADQLSLVPRPGTLTLARDVELLAPTEASSHVLVARVQQALGRFEEALDAYEVALSFDPDHLRAAWESGRILYEEKRWKEAAGRLGRFLEAVESSPDAEALKEHASSAAAMLEQCRRRM